MTSLQCKLRLCVGLCCAALSGCAGLKWTEDGGSLAAKSADGSIAASMDSAPVASPGASSDSTSGSAKEGDPKADKLEGQFALARLCESRGEAKQAEQYYTALLKKAPKDARIHHRLGVLAMKKGDFARAEERFQAAKSLAPPSAEMLCDIGYCNYLQQKLTEAESAIEESLKLEPTNATALNNLALVRGRQRRYQEALELFKRTNKEAESYANMGYVFAQNGETEQAKQMYLRALTLDNKMKAAAEAILQIDRREKTHMALAQCDPSTPAQPSNIKPSDQKGTRSEPL
jgi:Flp pilus assembly protein TadD